MIEKLRLRLRRWLIGYQLQTIGVEVTMFGYEDLKAKLKELGTTLDTLQKKSNELEDSLKRIISRKH